MADHHNKNKFYANFEPAMTVLDPRISMDGKQNQRNFSYFKSMRRSKFNFKQNVLTHFNFLPAFLNSSVKSNLNSHAGHCLCLFETLTLRGISLERLLKDFYLQTSQVIKGSLFFYHLMKLCVLCPMCLEIFQQKLLDPKNYHN